MKYNLKNLYHNIDKYDYISFDIFDTLLKRNVKSPYDIYKIIEYEYNKVEMPKISGFPELREKCEKDIWNLSKGHDLKLLNIYNKMDIYTASQKELLMKYELEIEKKYCQKEIDMFEVYTYCLNHNKKIILTSDMYHSKDYLEELLSSCGIKSYDHLYISSEYKATKASGALFECVLQDLKIKPTRLLHIGDSLRGDFINARKKHIKSIKIPRYINNCIYSNNVNAKLSINDNIIFSYINNNINQINSQFERIGFEVLGPLLVGFSYWLKEQLIEYDYTEVNFLSRDGYIMKKAFDILFHNKFKTNYFLASRRSLTVPLLVDAQTFSDTGMYIKYRTKETGKSILQRVGIRELAKEDQELSKKIFNREAITNKNKHDSFFDKYMNEIKQNAYKERMAFLEYGKINLKNEKAAIVDVGWNGSMQDAIANITKKKIDGFYLGLSNGNTNEKHNYLYTGKNDLFDPILISSYRGIMETFFTATHGSVDHYEKIGSHMKVLLQENTIDKYTETVINKIQKGALLFVEQIMDLLIDTEISRNNVFNPLYKLITKPTKKDIELFQDIIFTDIKPRKLVSNKPGCFYIIHPKIFFQDFLESDWRIGFLKRTFHVGNAYDKVMKTINNIVEKEG